MLKPIINPAKGKLRVLGYCSGSGNTLWKAYELQLAMEKTPEGCPFASPLIDRYRLKEPLIKSFQDPLSQFCRCGKGFSWV